MANTLVEMERLSTDYTEKGIIQTIIKDNPLFEKLPFIEIVGNALKYNMETGLAGATWYQVGDVWGESTPIWAQRSAALTILGGDADVDSFIAQTRSDVQDVEAAIIELKAKAIAHEFQNMLIRGATYHQTNANSMKGVMKLLAECQAEGATTLDSLLNAQVMNAAAADAPDTPVALSLPLLDKLVDLVLGGKPDFIMMSKAMRRKLTDLRRGAGSVITGLVTEYGTQVEAYNGIPVITNDWIPDTMNTTANVGGNPSLELVSGAWYGTNANSPIFAFQVGENALCGLQNQGIQTEKMGGLETKDARRTRIKWYCAMTLFSTVKAAVMLNCAPAL